MVQDSTSMNLGLPSNPDDLLGPARAGEYIPDIIGGMLPYNRNRPVFSAFYIEEMLADPRLCYALWLLKGPLLANAKFEVRSANSEIQKFVTAIMERFWRNDATKALKAIEWGYQGGEVVRTVRDGRITFDHLLDFNTRDVRVVTHYGKFSGITVNNVPFCNLEKKKKIFLGGAKAFLHTHWREKHPWYGQSRFYGAYVPWWEIWTNGGFRDVRRLWFFKNAYEGGTIYHPPGSTRIGNVVVPNKQLADEMITKKRAGGTLALINQSGADGQPLWRYEPPSGNPVPAGLLEYGKLLSDEELEGMGIPPEIIESGGDQGFGSATGRQVPQTAFYAVEQELLQSVVSDILRYIIRQDVALNFSEAEALEVEVIPLPLGDSGNGQQGQGYNGNQFTDENNKAPGLNRPDEQAVELPNDSLAKPVSMSTPVSPVSASGGRWITIGGKDNDGSGFHIQINGDGVIIKGGPKGMRGVHMSKIGDYFDKQKEELAKTETDNFEGVADFFDQKAKDSSSPKKQIGAAPGSTKSLTKIIAYQADKWGIPNDVYADYMDQTLPELEDVHNRQQEVKRAALKMAKSFGVDLTPKEISNVNNGKSKKQGGDYSSVARYDEIVASMESQYPDTLGSSPSDKLWELLAEPKKKLISKTDKELHELTDKKIEEHMKSESNKHNRFIHTPSEPDDPNRPKDIWD